MIFLIAGIGYQASDATIIRNSAGWVEGPER
jgi:hypothetical protein